MNKYLKKTLVISASVLMFLSVGTGINNVNAKRHYHYRSHRVYKSHMHKRVHHLQLNKRTWKKYVYNVSDPDALKDITNDYNSTNQKNLSLSDIMAKYSNNGITIPCFNFAGYFYPVKEFFHDADQEHTPRLKDLRNSEPSHGRILKVKDLGEIMFYSQGYLRQLAKLNNMSVKKYTQVYLKHDLMPDEYRENREYFNEELHPRKGHKISKYWYSKGFPTKSLLKAADFDAIHLLNKQRETNGDSPLKYDPTLQAIANTYTEAQYYKLDKLSLEGLTHHQKNIYHNLMRKFNNRRTRLLDNANDTGHNIYYGVNLPKEKPLTIAKAENSIWTGNSLALRDDPNYTTVGISIGPIGGGFDEEYGTDISASNHQDTSQIEAIVKQQTLNDLNQDRASVNESPLTEDSDLDNEAQRRSQELVSNFSHQNNNGQYASDEDSNVSAENIATTGGYSPESSANTMNNSMFYQEESNDGIHYDNIVSNDNVGVGVTANGNNIYLAEDFN